MPLADFLPILQIAIGPVILISGIGLLLLSMTNRFGRVIDRSRRLTLDHRAAQSEEDQARLIAEIAILAKRANIARAAITLASLSLLMAALLIIVLFLTALLNLEIVGLISGLFIGCMALLIASLLCFLSDINLSLGALKLELGSIQKKEG